MNKPSLVVMSGLPGSGKSTLAERIAQRLHIPTFSVDPIESAIISSGIPRSFETGVAAYVVAAALAGEQLSLGISVIVDAVNAEEEGKDVWRELAAKHDLALTILEMFVSDPIVHRQRVEARVRGLYGFPEVTWDSVEARRQSYTPWAEPTLRLDALDDLDANLEKALRYIQARRL